MEDGEKECRQIASEVLLMNPITQVKWTRGNLSNNKTISTRTKSVVERPGKDDAREPSNPGRVVQ